MSRGASGSISLMVHLTFFFYSEFSRASSEYISERLDSSTHFQFTMPWRPDSLNRRPGWTSSLTVTCGLSTCTIKRWRTSSTAKLFSAPLPGQVHHWHLRPFKERVEPRGRTLPAQDQEHETVQCLRCHRVCKGV